MFTGKYSRQAISIHRLGGGFYPGVKLFRAVCQPSGKATHRRTKTGATSPTGDCKPARNLDRLFTGLFLVVTQLVLLCKFLPRLFQIPYHRSLKRVMYE